VRPMLATPGTHVPAGAEWSHEVKWDGMRILADVSAGAAEARLTSRNENVVTAGWPDVAPSPVPGRDLLVDGELIALNGDGLPDFRVLQERIHVRRAADVRRLAEALPVVYMVFDLLRLDGTDLTGEPLARRRALLADLLGEGSWQVPPAYDDGAMLHAATLEQGLEGIVSKRLSSTYRPGQRSRSWQKLAHRRRDSFVVGGWRPQEGTSDRLAALLVGTPDPDGRGGLTFRGRVGSGIGGRAAAVLSEAVAGLGRPDSPFDAPVPAIDSRGTRWVDPVVVVDVDSLGRGYDRLRQPSYRGLRTDLSAADLAGPP